MRTTLRTPPDGRLPAAGPPEPRRWHGLLGEVCRNCGLDQAEHGASPEMRCPPSPPARP